MSSTADKSGRSLGAVTVLWIGLIAGTLDIADALIFSYFRGATPKMVFQYIASGLVGIQRAHALGIRSAVLGVAMHYCIAMCWTMIFYLLSRRVGIMARWPAASGLIYGLFVYLFMNLVALPLSNVPHVRSAPSLASRVNGILAVMVCIGMTSALLISYCVRKCSQP